MTYEYACTACGHAWEAEQSISASPLSECPHCHQATAKRQVSGGAGFILKGGGWYADLYSSSGTKKSAEVSSDSGSTSSTESKTKTDAASTSPSTTTKTTSAESSSTPSAPVKSPSSTGAASS
jgi:putative FmdB family regulatory protein